MRVKNLVGGFGGDQAQRRSVRLNLLARGGREGGIPIQAPIGVSEWVRRGGPDQLDTFDVGLCELGRRVGRGDTM